MEGSEEESESVKRPHITTGDTPHKPEDKHSRSTPTRKSSTVTDILFDKLDFVLCNLDLWEQWQLNGILGKALNHQQVQKSPP